MKPRQAAASARCGSVGRPYQLNDLLRFDKNEPAVALCDQCLHSLKYADAHTWEMVSRLSRQDQDGELNPGQKQVRTSHAPRISRSGWPVSPASLLISC